MIGYVFTALLIMGTSASPMFKNLQNMNSGCMTKCIANLKNMTMEVDFSKPSKYGSQYSQYANIDETCESVAEARDCVAKCDVPINPFDMKAMRIMCSEEKRAELKKHSACYEQQGNATTERCNKVCGSIEESAEGMKESGIFSNDTNEFDFSKLINSMGDVCDAAKCQARCSRDAFNELCRETDPEAGTFMQQFTEEILEATSDDLNRYGMKSLMKSILPKQCHFILNPGQLYNDTDASESSDDKESGFGDLFSKMFKELSTEEQTPKKQSKFEETQLRLLDKEERNLDKQIEKLNLEIELLNKQLTL